MLRLNPRSLFRSRSRRSRNWRPEVLELRTLLSAVNVQPVIDADSIQPDQPFRFHVDYTASAEPGVGASIHIHFDSSQLQLSENDLDIVYETGLGANAVIQLDRYNGDGDSSTDMFVNLLWIDINATWNAGKTEATRLVTLEFTPTELFSSTTVRMTGDLGPNRLPTTEFVELSQNGISFETHDFLSEIESHDEPESEIENESGRDDERGTDLHKVTECQDITIRSPNESVLCTSYFVAAPFRDDVQPDSPPENPNRDYASIGIHDHNGWTYTLYFVGESGSGGNRGSDQLSNRVLHESPRLNPGRDMNAPVAETLVAETLVAETLVAETLVAETPVAETPVAVAAFTDARLPEADTSLLQSLVWAHQPDIEASDIRTQITQTRVEVAHLKRWPEFNLNASWFAIDDNRPTRNIVDVGQDARSLGAQTPPIREQTTDVEMPQGDFAVFSLNIVEFQSGRLRLMRT